MEHNAYWARVVDAACGPDNEPTDAQLLGKLAEECGEYVKTLKATEEHVHQAFSAIYNLQDRSVLGQYLLAVEDPKIIRIIYEIDETESANIGDPVGVMLAGNPHTPKDVLQNLSEIDFDEDYEDEQIQDALKQNPSAAFLFN
jgi:hypothetical protein